MDNLRIAMITPEAAPLVRTGGLGDVLGALPSALATRGHRVSVFVPKYASIAAGSVKLEGTGVSPTVNLGGNATSFSLERVITGKSGPTVYLVGCGKYFDRADLYVDPKTGSDYIDNDERFAMFTHACLEAIRGLGGGVDVIHGHDWQTALAPAFLKTRYLGDPTFAKSRTVLTVHNIGYQGISPGERFHMLGLPEGYFYPVTGPVEYFGKVNFLKAGIALSDRVTTVSETYAREIQNSSEYGFGLEGVLRQRGAEVVGILNGVDYSVWSPNRDRRIPRQYHLKNLSGKRECKTELLREAGLPIREKSPLIGMITRLADQKGLDLLSEVAEELFALPIQVIVLGTGDQKYHELLSGWQAEYPDKIKVYLTFNDALAHRIEAGADLFLMPSRYEPCGLNQMYSLRYGTIPIVRKTGGLADTVQDYNPATRTGTGFVFEEYSGDAMIGAIRRAIEVFPKKRKWNEILKAGMTADFSWDASAAKYDSLYRQLVAG
jgi:starch synthase